MTTSSGRDHRSPLSAAPPRHSLAALFSAAVAAVDPGRLIRDSLTRQTNRLSVRVGGQTSHFPLDHNVFIIGAGKGAGRMAQALLPLLGEHLVGGSVVVPHDAVLSLDPVSVIVAEHPLPGSGSLRGGTQLAAMLAERGPSDLICFCLTGGASSLLVGPVPGVSLEDKLTMNRLLLACGADIQEINTVRKHLSRLKGGQLARLAAPASVISFILSDVIGDDLSTVGSGPTVADPTTFVEAWRILERYELLSASPESVTRHLSAGMRGSVAETPKPHDPIFARVHNYLLGSNRLALEAAASDARHRGFDVHMLPEPVAGDTTQAARAFAQQLRTRLAQDRSPTCVLAGGETTVQLTGTGRGGRNQEFALVVAQQLQDEAGWTLLSAGTDGRDGPTDAAGAYVDGTSIRRARAKGLDPSAALRNNDSYTFFAALGDVFQPGPTGTNVMDIKIVLIGPPPGS